MKLLLDYSSTYVRLFFRIFFFVLFVLISVVGNKCCSNRAKLNILKGQRVRLTNMTGWLQNFDSFLSPIAIRALPGGWLGTLMIISYLLNLGSDFVSTTIQLVTVQDRCTFGTGLVVFDIPLSPQV